MDLPGKKLIESIKGFGVGVINFFKKHIYQFKKKKRSGNITNFYESLQS